MTLASLLHDDSPTLPISRHSKNLSSGDFSWADMPLVGDINSLIAAEPLEMNLNNNAGKKDDTPNLNDVEITSLSTCSSFSSMSDNDNEFASSKKRRGDTGAASFNSEIQHVVAIGNHPLSGDAVPRSLTWEDSETEQDLDNLKYLRPTSGNPKKHQKIDQPALE